MSAASAIPSGAGDYPAVRSRVSANDHIAAYEQHDLDTPSVAGQLPPQRASLEELNGGSSVRSRPSSVSPSRHRTSASAPAEVARRTVDPRQVFLDAKAVMRRYGWGKTKGYQNLKNRELTPPPVMTHPDRWRLDQLLAWEDRRIAAAENNLVHPSEPSLERLESRLPGPKRPRRRSA